MTKNSNAGERSLKMKRSKNLKILNNRHILRLSGLKYGIEFDCL